MPARLWPPKDLQQEVFDIMTAPSRYGLNDERVGCFLSPVSTCGGEIIQSSSGGAHCCECSLSYLGPLAEIFSDESYAKRKADEALEKE